MRLAICPGESLRLCSSYARHAENHPAPRGPDYRQWMAPTTRGERCFDWYPQPPKTTPPTTGT